MTSANTKVALIDYDEILFAPMGNEAELLTAAGATWQVAQCRTAEQVVEMAHDAAVVVVQTVRPLLTRAVINQLPACRCIVRAGAGYDSVDYRATTDRGIMLCNTPTYCSDDVADHAISLMLESVRHLSRLDKAMRQGRFARELAIPTRRLAGATLGIIGLGRIGSTVARRVSGWDMTVLATDPYLDPRRAEALGVELVTLNELLARSDLLSVHCPLTEETHHMLNGAAFARAKPGLVLVNTARGPVVEEAALIAALEEGTVWAAGLDVFEEEPLPPDSPLFALDNVTLTPHVSANSPEARRDLYRLIVEIAQDVVQGRIPAFVVNPEVLGSQRLASS